MDYNNNYKVRGTMRSLLESNDVGDLGQGVNQPNIPTNTNESVTQPPLPSNQELAHPDLAFDQQLRGNENPIKTFIDKLVDTKNKIFDQNTTIEIQKGLDQTNNI